MQIALLNVRITFQKNQVVSDEIGDRRNVWEDYYSCYATVSGEGVNEKALGGLTVVDAGTAFAVRCCRQTMGVAPDGFRVLFNGEIFNIISVDHMNYRNRRLKFRCEEVRR